VTQRARAVLLVAFTAAVTVLAPSMAVGRPIPADAHRIVPASRTSRPSTMGLGFEPNRGQVAAPVRFLLQGTASTLFVTARGIVVRSEGKQPSITRLQFIGAATRPKITASGLLRAHVSYFLGHDTRFWYRNIPTYSRVEYHDIFPRIDWVLHREVGGVQDEFLLRPGARVGEIKMQILQSGFPGRERGSALGVLGGGLLYRSVGDTRGAIPARLVVDAAGFVTLQPDPRKFHALHADFKLDYSTYLGGSSFDFATSVAADSAGDAYIVGATASPDFPTKHAIARNLNSGGDGEDAFIAKLSPAGTLLYATYLGGSGDDEATGVALDGESAYVTGFTQSADFPKVRSLTVGAGGRCGRAPLGGSAFLARVSRSGTALTFSTCLGGYGTSWGAAVAVRDGNAYVTGSTTARDFPTVRPIQRRNAGGIDAFVAEFTRPGNRLRYSTYLGGEGDDQGAGIAVDAAGNVYVAGSTDSTRFPTHNAIQGRFGGGSGETGTGDAFVTKLSAAGRVVYSTYLGGTKDDQATAIAADAAGNAYVTGITESPDFPISHALQDRNRGGADTFVSKIGPSGASLVYSTYLGGSGNDGGHDIAVDMQGNVDVTGSTASPDFPLAHPFPMAYGGGVYYGDAFVAQLNPAGDTLNFSTYLGGVADDVGMGIAAGRAGAIYVAGGTSSRDFPTKDAMSKEPPPRGNAWVARIIETRG
jgi:hypothetical protein